MLGVTEENPKVTDGTGNDQRLIPINKYGISLVSMGFLIEEGQPVIWRAVSYTHLTLPTNREV